MSKSSRHDSGARAVLWCAVSTRKQASDEKVSLEAQEEEGRALAGRMGWQVAEVLRVPGHSRRYIDFHEVAADMRAAGIDAMDRLRELWGRFDVLVVRDASRFARTQSLHAYIVERTIESGAVIWSLRDGLIDSQNFRMFISMGGYAAAGEVDQIIARMRIGMQGRTARGLPANKVPLGWLAVRDPNNGRVLQVVPDPAQAQFFRDLAELVLAGVPYLRLEAELQTRGHFPDKTPPPGWMYQLLYNPFYWGHTAWGRRTRARHYGPEAEYCIDETIPPPEGVIIARNTHPPIWGELTDDLRAEIKRRQGSKGRRGPGFSYRFSGLLECEVCGYPLVVAVKTEKRAYVGYRCRSSTMRRGETPCTRAHQISERKLVRQVTRLLEAILREEDFESLRLPEPPRQAATLAAEVESARRQIGRLIDLQAGAEGELGAIYAEKIAEADRRLTMLRKALEQAAREELRPERASQERAAARLKAQGIAALWALPRADCNRVLRALMGPARFVVRPGEGIVAIRVP